MLPEGQPSLSFGCASPVLALLSVGPPLTGQQKPLATASFAERKGFFRVNPPEAPGQSVLMGQLGSIPETAAEAAGLFLAGS